MATATGAVIGTMIAALLPCVAVGQTNSNEPIRTVRISGRLTEASRNPISNATLKCSNANGHADLTIITDQDGRFVYSAVSRSVYEIYIVTTSIPPTFMEVGKLVAVEGQDLDLGNIVIRKSPARESVVELVAPVKVGHSSPAQPKRSSGRSRAKPAPKTPPSVAAMFIGAGGMANIIHDDGKLFQPPKEKDQVDFAYPQISEDRRTVGWLAEFPFCCTSYPISLALVVYRSGKPLRRFKGDDRSIFDWKFVEGGKQVALYQDFLHGTQAQHYELRDVETGRLIDKWDGELTPKAPKWTKGMQS